MTNTIKRALLSVSNKEGLIEFAKALASLNIEIISTGGTSKLLKEKNVSHRSVEDVTGLQEMLEGRVKTLHPKIHGGILGKRDKHAEEASKHQIEWIDLVVVNFYPFNEAVRAGMKDDDMVELIDIGGPTMVRAAAKNFKWVGVVIDPKDYELVLSELKQEKMLSDATRRMLAQKVFAETAQYDAMIANYFAKEEKELFPARMTLPLEKTAELRYGENPHQKASAYHLVGEKSGVLSAKQHQGKPLSYNNFLDAEAAHTCVNEFTDPAAVIVKHANPCGAATASSIENAYDLAYHADALSAFGGIVALNRPCTKEIAKSITDIFMEVVLAPSYTDDALQLFASKPNLRVLELPQQLPHAREMKFITGGVLMQERDPQVLHKSDIKVVTHVVPTGEQLDAMMFAWRVLKHIKSNGILIAKNNQTVGIGAGQVSRIDAVDLAVRKASDHIRDAVLASDAFFPFRDSIDRVASTGIRAIIQPGGSVRDEEVIAACNEHNIAMVFTGMRCFRH